MDAKMPHRRNVKRIAVFFPVTYLVETPIEVQVEYQNKSIRASAQDIGENGMGLITTAKLGMGTVVRMSFSLADDAAQDSSKSRHDFKIKGEIRYGFLLKDASYRYGTLFMAVSAADRRFIKEYIRRRELKLVL